MDDQCTIETLDAAKLSGVLQLLAHDEALICPGLDLARDLEHYFSAAAHESRGGALTQLSALTDLWASRGIRPLRRPDAVSNPTCHPLYPACRVCCRKATDSRALVRTA